MFPNVSFLIQVHGLLEVTHKRPLGLQHNLIRQHLPRIGSIVSKLLRWICYRFLDALASLAFKLSVSHTFSVVQSLPGMDAPPRGKTGCPAPQKAGFAPPRPAKLTKSAGRSGAKLTADSIDTPFHYACK